MKHLPRCSEWEAIHRTDMNKIPTETDQELESSSPDMHQAVWFHL